MPTPARVQAATPSQTLSVGASPSQVATASCSSSQVSDRWGLRTTRRDHYKKKLLCRYQLRPRQYSQHQLPPRLLQLRALRYMIFVLMRVSESHYYDRPPLQVPTPSTSVRPSTTATHAASTSVSGSQVDDLDEGRRATT